MSVINILSPHVADMIAAGEVVERPASVVKELVENAFDAGATKITVEIRSGGAAFLRVTDDGCGMSPEDAGIAFLRHATSKLRDERGLEGIRTMGFRGEALAAIAAVSRIRLTTRRPGDESGTLLTLEAGDIQEMGSIGCPDGTTLTVTDLFYNTPARQKFLKSDRSEATACEQAALRCALGHPEVSVRFLRDGTECFFTPGGGDTRSCIYALLGRELASDLLACVGENDGISVSGYVSSPAAGRGNRAQQYFFCNGRVIKSPLLQAALEQAYKNTLLTGRYPACVLYLTLGYGSVDVNVHPAKTEVKFREERRVFDAVYYAVLSALEKEAPGKAAPAPAGKPSSAPTAPAKPEFFRSMDAAAYRAGGSALLSSHPRGTSAPSPSASAPTLRDSGRYFQQKMPAFVPETPKNEPISRQNPAVFVPAGSRIVENSVQNVEKPLVPDHKIVGEAMKTYILVEQGDSLILIDKHAAHERMIFDRLKAQERQIMAQSLLVPATLRPTEEEGELLNKNADLLRELGFELEPFGEREWIVRAVPADMEVGEIPAAIEEICEKLRRGGRLDPRDARDEILHTVACKAAIKAGWDSSPAELERVAEAVLSGQVKYCPHGRPVSVVWGRKELDRQFKRIV